MSKDIVEMLCIVCYTEQKRDIEGVEPDGWIKTYMGDVFLRAWKTTCIT